MSLMKAILETGNGAAQDADFPHAPPEWLPAAALEAAHAEGLTLGADHWDALRALQEYFARNEDIAINLRELHDALDEKFHSKGGIRTLYLLFPGGPVAQGCRLAGLKAPPGAIDKGFGSVS